MTLRVTEVLTSQWGKLSPHLIATFYEVEKEVKRGHDGKETTTWKAVKDGPVVGAPLTDVTMSVSLNWQSPFDNSGAEAKAPALMAMLQSGAALPLVNYAMGVGTPKFLKDIADKARQASADFFQHAQGRTGITKLNSTQIFTGMQPVKIQATAMFRAWIDPVKEVRQPVDQLISWALPKELSPDGFLLSRAASAAGGKVSWLDALLPSKSPSMVAMRYKGMTFLPMVIEGFEYPLNSPISDKGEFVELAIPLTICSLTAIDRADWSDMRQVVL